MAKRLNLNRKMTIGTGKKDEIDIFKFGTLIQLESHCWLGSKRLPKKATTEISKDEKKSKWFKANKNLIDRTKLADINLYIAEARNTIWEYALPFPIKGVYFLPNAKRDVVNTKLKEIKRKFDEAVGEFEVQYSDYIADAEANLGEYFNSSDYPTEITNKFGIRWRFFEMTIPSGITKETYEEESNRFKQLMEQTEQMGILALRDSFGKIVNHLSETLTGKLDGEKRRIRQDSLDKVQAFFIEFKNKNVFNDKGLENLIASAQAIVGDVSPKDLKDQNVTKQINDQMKIIKKELDSSTETMRRKLTFY